MESFEQGKDSLLGDTGTGVAVGFSASGDWIPYPAKAGSFACELRYRNDCLTRLGFWHRLCINGRVVVATVSSEDRAVYP